MDSESESSSENVDLEDEIEKGPTPRKITKYSRAHLADKPGSEKRKVLRKKRNRSDNNSIEGKTFSYTGTKRDKKSEKLRVNNTGNKTNPRVQEANEVSKESSFENEMYEVPDYATQIGVYFFL
jgi:hypothetical protein